MVNLRSKSLSSHRELNITATSVRTTPPSKMLLLSGDEYVVSPSGISRTVYNLRSHISTNSIDPCTSVEEVYNLHTVEKKFIPRYRKNINEKEQGIKIQEIKNGIETAGTGSCTWESSIISALYFASRPELLKGRVLELGSGVGLAGMLTSKLACSNHQIDSCLKSLTFTDYSVDVLKSCQENLQHNHSLLPVDTNVCYLNWYDSIVQEENKAEEKYDTIIASDVAYRKQDIIPLLATISKYLGDEDESAAHLFGPNNRAILHDLVTEANKHPTLQVETEMITMDRSRLAPYDNIENTVRSSDTSTTDQLSCRTTYFLHLIISSKKNESQEHEHPDITDID